MKKSRVLLFCATFFLLILTILFVGGGKSGGDGAAVFRLALDLRESRI